MHKNRTEAFSDGVFAIIITIMVLELKAPHGAQLSDLLPLAPIFLSYALSFTYVAIYWNNHHHLFQIVRQVTGGTLWANAHLLFWLSLTPFVTAWAGENHFESTPVALYGFVLLMSSIAYYILAQTLIASHGKESEIARAMGRDRKGKISTAIYAAAMPLAWVSPWISLAGYVLVAAIWLIPDRRVERELAPGQHS